MESVLEQNRWRRELGSEKSNEPLDDVQNSSETTPESIEEPVVAGSEQTPPIPAPSSPLSTLHSPPLALQSLGEVGSTLYSPPSTLYSPPSTPHSPPSTASPAPAQTQPDFKITLSVVGKGTHFREGDAITFAVDVQEECYLALFAHQSDDTTVVLYPNAYQSTTRVEANTRVRIPGTEQATFQIVVTPPFGKDTVEAIACSSKSTLHGTIEKQIAKSTTPYTAVSRGFIAKAISNDNDPNARWARSKIQVTTSR